jgi:hypothetical protein
LVSGGRAALARFLSDRLKVLNKMPQRFEKDLWANSYADRLDLLAETAKSLGGELTSIDKRLREERSSSYLQGQESKSIENIRGQCARLKRDALNLTIFLQQVLEQRGRDKPAPKQTTAQMRAERHELMEAVGPAQKGIPELIDSLTDLRKTLGSDQGGRASIRRDEVRIDIEQHRRDEIA